MKTEKYKQTEVGLIPSDWEVKCLGEIVKSFQLGGNYPNNELEGSNVLIKMANLGRGNIELSKRYFISSEIIPSENDRAFYGDVFFNTRNTLDLVGKVAIWRDELPKAYFNSNIMRIIFKEEKISSNFFMNLIFNTRNSIYQLRGIATGTTSVAAIYTRDLIKLLVPVPTKAEQTAIATALSDADALISSLEKLIAKKRNIKQGAMQQLLNPMVNDELLMVNENATNNLQLKEGWEVKKLGDYLDYIQPTEYLVTDTEYNDNNQTPVLTAGKTFILGYTNEEHGIFNNLPVIIFDDFTTAIKYVDFPFKAKSSAMKMLVPKHKNVNLRFIYELMLRIKYPLGDHKRHWIGEYRHLEIILPDSSDEQNKIATILSDMDAEIRALETKLAKYKMVKLGMMQNLLTGKIRLV